MTPDRGARSDACQPRPAPHTPSPPLRALFSTPIPRHARRARTAALDQFVPGEFADPHT